MSQMGQPSLPGPDVPGDFDGFRDGQVSGMGFIPEAVDDENGDVAKMLTDRDGNSGAHPCAGEARTQCVIDGAANPQREIGDALDGECPEGLTVDLEDISPRPTRMLSQGGDTGWGRMHDGNLQRPPRPARYGRGGDMRLRLDRMPPPH